MVALVGFLILILMIVFLSTRKFSVHFCLVVLPIVGALICGAGIAEIGDFVKAGISSIHGTAVMLTFAVLFFGTLFDAGMFTPIINRILKVSKGDPLKVCLGTAVIATLSSLDGSAATTYLITCTAMIPLFTQLGMRITSLAAITGLCAGVMNMTPWGGPTMRAATVLEMDVADFFSNMIPTMLFGLVVVYLITVLIGLGERKRVGIQSDSEIRIEEENQITWKLYFNWGMTVLAIFCLVRSILPTSTVFVILYPIVLTVNYPDLNKQKETIKRQAPSAITTASIIFSAGVFTGIMKNAGFIEAMSNAIASHIPVGGSALLPLIVALCSIPLSLCLDPDSIYYGVLPVIISIGAGFGISGQSIATAMLLGGYTVATSIAPLTGATWVLVSESGLELTQHQKRTIPWAFVVTGGMALFSLIFGII